MSMTERLYYADSHLVEFDARVTYSAALGEGRVAVRLDRTAFYPTGGGQPTDTGVLGAARVVECVDEEEAGVVHVVEGEAPEVGARVRGRVDWPRRLDHMQQHTGQHILSQAFAQLFGAETRAFRMSQHASEIDVALDAPSDERVERAVELANQIIWEDRPVSVRTVTREEAARLPLRRDSAREGELRVIEIEGYDLSPCGGTHARRTGEVGLVAARSWERAKGLTRIEFVAGGRALNDYRAANSAARAVAAQFSVGRDEAAAAVARLREEHRQQARRLRELEEVAARAEAAGLLTQAAVVDEGAGARIVARAFEGRDAESLKRLALAVINASPATVALLGSLDGEDARLVFARGANAAGDMNALMREACSSLNGRGGGRPDMAQGGGRADAEQFRAVIDAARQRLATKSA